MNLVRALLACVHLLKVSACEKLVACWDKCVICISGLTTGLTQPVRNLFISVKALCELYWKVAFTIYSVLWRLWNFVHTWYTASCCMFSRLPRLLPGIPYAGLSLLCCICSQMQEAALHLLWLWTPGQIQTICTALAHSWCSTGTQCSDPAPPSRASFTFGSFSISRTIRRALNCCWNVLRSAPCACLALLCQICGQLKEAALHLLRSWTPGWALTTTTTLAQFWYSTGKEDPAAAPPRRASFAFISFAISQIIRRAPSCCWTLLQGAPRVCLALLCQVCGQLKEAALQIMLSWTPGWIQTTCAIIAHLWHSTGKKDPAAAPPSKASCAFGSFTISKIVLSCCTALLLDSSCACLALLCRICSQLQKAALHLLWSWTPSWIQTVCAILAFLRHNTGKQSPADAPPETASFGFGKYVVIIARRAKPCPSGLPPSSSSTVVEPEAALDVRPAPAPAPAQHMHCAFLTIYVETQQPVLHPPQCSALRKRCRWCTLLALIFQAEHALVTLVVRCSSTSNKCVT